MAGAASRRIIDEHRQHRDQHGDQLERIDEKTSAFVEQAINNAASAGANNRPPFTIDEFSAMALARSSRLSSMSPRKFAGGHVERVHGLSTKDSTRLQTCT